jgi:ketosteroid isomerase-like protein
MLVQERLQAQSVSDEQALQAFARDFMNAYNKQDHAALKAMYTAQAQSTAENGITHKGAENIAQAFQQNFIKEDATILVSQTGVQWSDAQRAYICTGTYETYGKTYVYDIVFRYKTAYRNTMIKEQGKWKIANSVLTTAAQTMLMQKNGALSEWKSTLNAALKDSEAVGKEIGFAKGVANAVYALIDWPSAEAAKAFFASSNWQKATQKLTTGEKPEVIYLEGK